MTIRYARTWGRGPRQAAPRPTAGKTESFGASWSTLRRSGLLPQFLALCFAVWLHAANSMLAATTLPSAVEEVGGATLIAWAFTLYQLGSILAAAGSGLMVRRTGVRLGLLGASLVYGLGCIVCAIASHMEIVLIGRLMQGIGGGMLIALTYIALTRNFPAALMPRLMALISATWSTSAFCGPLIGGTFSSLGLWRFGFWAFALQALLFVACALFVIKEGKATGKSAPTTVPLLRLSVLTAAIVMISMAGALVDALLSPLLSIASLALLWLFLRMDRARVSTRMFPSNTLNVRAPVSAGLFMVFTAAAGTMSFIVYGPILLEKLYGITPLAAGYVVALEAVSWGAAAILFSGFPQAKEKHLIRTGTAIVSLGVLGFAFAMPSGSLWLVIACAIAQGGGFGIMWGFVVRRMIAVVPAEERDVAASSMPTTQQIGFAIGASAAGIVANTAGFAEGLTMEAAQSAAFWVFAAFMPLALVANLAAWRLTR